MADYPLTDAQIMQLAYRVRGLIRSESKSVPEVPMVDTLEGIESFPVVQTIGKVSKYARAPVSLLSQPAWDAVKGYIEELQTAIGKVEDAIRNAENATEDSEKVTEESREQIRICKETIASALEVLAHPPVVGEDNYLRVYDLESHTYVRTDANMKGATFTPRLDPADGMLYWSNDQGLENPEPTRVEGNVMFATFDIDWQTGELYARTMPEYKGAGFEIDANGNFNVVI